EQRQLLTERFNHDPKILVFILSTRSGGLGINLTGADTVILYDSDWNPCMDRQCQDRCHRIGQTRDVSIYRFISEHTIEENVLLKAKQKRKLDKLVMTEGDFTTDYFEKMKWRELLDVIAPKRDEDVSDDTLAGPALEQCLAMVEDDKDVNAARVARIEEDIDLTEFAENSNSAAENAATTSATEAPADGPADAPADGPADAPADMEAGVADADQRQSADTLSPNTDIDDTGESDRAMDHVDNYMLRFMERELGISIDSDINT
ncbi:8139_t:CDS:2, partial [Paraglomus occultum]